jgi:hypothetical protein
VAGVDPPVSASWGQWFIGDLDELAFYDRALPAERVDGPL